MEMAHTGIDVETDDRIECRVVTSDIEAELDALAVDDGVVLARTGHTSAALSTNEAEDRLLRDMLEAFTDLAPPDDWYFHDQLHLDSDTQRNAFGHILAAMVRRPVMVPLVDGDLRLGTYEDVLFFEFDGPRTRTIDLTVMS